jgi:hypothetical protein
MIPTRLGLRRMAAIIGAAIIGVVYRVSDVG